MATKKTKAPKATSSKRATEPTKEPASPRLNESVASNLRRQNARTMLEELSDAEFADMTKTEADRRSLRKAAPERSAELRQRVGRAEVVLPGGVNLWPVSAAFELLTGIDPMGSAAPAGSLEWKAFNVFGRAVVAMVAPRLTEKRWLLLTASKLKPTPDEKIAQAIEFVRQSVEEKSAPHLLRRVLGWHCDELFHKLTDQQIVKALSLHKPDKTRGATNCGPSSVLAELCLACGALHVKRKSRERVSNALRTAAARAAKVTRKAV